MPYAFRCKPCGHLHAAAHAGNRGIPRTCVVCGRRGPDEWDVLSELNQDRLAELGLSPEEVEVHAPDPEANLKEDLARCQEDLRVLEEKEQAWKARPPAEWQKELDALYDTLDALAQAEPDDDPEDYGKWENDKAAVRQQIGALLAREWTDRDGERKQHLEQVIAAGGTKPSSQGPRKSRVQAQERQRLHDAT